MMLCFHFRRCCCWYTGRQTFCDHAEFFSKQRKIKKQQDLPMVATFVCNSNIWNFQTTVVYTSFNALTCEMTLLPEHFRIGVATVMLNYAGEYGEYCDACQAAVTVIRSSDAALKSCLEWLTMSYILGGLTKYRKGLQRTTMDRKGLHRTAKEQKYTTKDLHFSATFCCKRLLQPCTTVKQYSPA